MDHLREDPGYYVNITASYDDLVANGPPMPPLAFPRVRRDRAERVSGRIFNPAYNETVHVEKAYIIYRIVTSVAKQNGASGCEKQYPEVAYWLGRTLKRCIFGVVKHCTVLQRRQNDDDCVWEVTGQSAAVKILSLENIRNMEHLEDPYTEVSALYYINSKGMHPHVIGSYDVLEDDEYLMIFMPYCSSGDLLSYLNSQPRHRLAEPLARYWFRQLLEALSHLQRMGVSHRDLSLENVMIDEGSRSLIIDFGMCARIPYASDEGGIISVDDGCSLRYLISRQKPRGKPMYVSPEVVCQEEGFDGFAVDLWALGVMLFMMLTGRPAFDYPHKADVQYSMIVNGALEFVVKSFRIDLSKEATDLLQRMLQEEPRKRPSMAQLLAHPWILKEEDIVYEPPPNEEWRC